MSTRRNGGIIGPQNRTSSVAAPGVWHLDDNQESVYARNWPGFTPTVPSAPAVGIVTISGSTATIPFTLGYNGGSPITSVTAIIYPGGTKTTVTGSPPSSPITVTGLSANVVYYFAVYATNANGDSTYNISNTVYISTVNYLAVAGGGGGGYNDAGGGGGGGVLTGNLTFKSGTTYTISVGAGGSGSASTGNNSTSGAVGSNSSISGSDISTVTVNGGGGGSGFYVNSATTGGSGGGGNYFFAPANGITSQGYAGGTGGNVTTGYYIGGGGGGAGSSGGNASTTPGSGGSGLSSSITGSSIAYAGGGGGGGDLRTTTASVYFNGSTDYLTAPSNTSTFGTGDFTVESWIYPTGIGGGAGSQQIITAIGSINGFSFSVWSNNVHVAQYGVADLYDFPCTLGNNNWYHIAITRSSNVIKAFVNGVQAGTNKSDSTNFTGSSTVYIGAGISTNLLFAGNISNLRIIKGTALYTSNFTPPTTPLPIIPNTSLLTCLGTGFFDASSNNFAISIAGSTYNANTSPFTTQTANIAGASGGSGGGGTGGGSNGNATTGTVNTGGGGGGGAFLNKTAAAGGSGVVILSLPTGVYSGNVTGSPTVTTSGSNTILKYTGNGTYVA